MRTEEIKVFSIGELSEDAKARAIEEMRTSDVIGQWLCDDFVEYAKEMIYEEFGLDMNDVEVYFRLAYCQGDGLHFECKDVRSTPQLRKITEEAIGKDESDLFWNDVDEAEVSIKFTNGGVYHYEYACRDCVDCEVYYPKCGRENAEKAIEALKDAYMDLCDRLADIGYKDIYPEDDYYEDLSDCNGYEYLEDGQFWAR